MSTTTIRLETELRQRVARIAAREGKTAHAFIVEAVAERAEQAERREQLFDEAEARYAQFIASGMSVDWDAMRRYLEAKAKGQRAKKPAPRKLTR